MLAPAESAGLRDLDATETIRHLQPSATFDEPNLVSAAGLIPLMALAGKAGLRELADERMSVPTDKGANSGLKVATLVGGMVAGAYSIDDLALLRQGGMGRILARAYAPSTLGRSGGRSFSDTCASSMRSPPGSWSRWPG